MRSFIVSVIIILLCLSVCVLNSLWTRTRIDTHLTDIESLTPQDVRSFTERWQRDEYIFFFTVKQTYLRDITDAVQKLEASLEYGDEFEFAAAKKALIYKMQELRRSQSFDIKTIL